MQNSQEKRNPKTKLEVMKVFTFSMIPTSTDMTPGIALRNIAANISDRG